MRIKYFKKKYHINYMVLNDVLNLIEDNKYTSIFVTSFIIIFGGFTGPQLPRFLRRLFNNIIFKLCSLVLIIHLSNKDPQLGIIVAIGFLLVFTMIRNREFFAEISNELKNDGVESINNYDKMIKDYENFTDIVDEEPEIIKELGYIEPFYDNIDDFEKRLCCARKNTDTKNEESICHTTKDKEIKNKCKNCNEIIVDFHNNIQKLEKKFKEGKFYYVDDDDKDSVKIFTELGFIKKDQAIDEATDMYKIKIDKNLINYFKKIDIESVEELCGDILQKTDYDTCKKKDKLGEELIQYCELS